MDEREQGRREREELRAELARARDQVLPDDLRVLLTAALAGGAPAGP